MCSRIPHPIPMGLAWAMMLAGCSDLSGLGGKSQYACAAPQGVQCNSVSGNYYNLFQPRSSNSNTALPAKAHAPATSSSASSVVYASSAARTAPLSPTFEPAALRSQPRILRLWIKPWEDSEHDLVDQSYVYVQTDPGRWQIAHAQRQIRDAYMPLKPPLPQVAAPAAETPSAAEAPAPAPASINPPPAAVPAFPAPDVPTSDIDAAEILPAPPA